MYLLKCGSYQRKLIMEEKDVIPLLDLAGIIYRSRSGTLTAAERRILENWLAASSANRRLAEELTSQSSLPEILEELDNASLQRSMERVYKTTGVPSPAGHLPERRVYYILRYKWWAAAAILLLTAGAFFRYGRSSDPTGSIALKQAPPTVAPGGNKAMLTLGNGRQILLDSASDGMLASQGNALISKSGSGQLAYHIKESPGKPNEIFYNTLATPRGGQYRLLLPDGSTVWLNAASSITYPTAFTEKERIVRITGEAYFEVIHNDRSPFIVKAGNQEIRDLGTHFNINAYANEPTMKTTLLEGSVKVSNLVLQPGQQASTNSQGETGLVREVKVEDVVAWKEGRFRFTSVDLGTIMRQVARWYDIEVEYRGQVTGTLSGGISRDADLMQLFHILELTRKVHFNIEGKKVIVIPM